MHSLRFLCVLLLLFAGNNLIAQEYMILEKEGRPKRYRFQAGDQLRFKLLNNDSIYDDQISAVFDTAIALGNLSVPYQNFDRIWVYKPTFADTRLKFISMVCGGLFFSLDTFNRLVNNDHPKITRTGLIVLGTGLTIGCTIHLSHKRWFRIGGNNRARYQDLRMTVP